MENINLLVSQELFDSPVKAYFRNSDDEVWEPGLLVSIGHWCPYPYLAKMGDDHIISWSNKGDTVLDPFMGSGTTGVACKNLNRNFIGIELDKEYFKIAEERINEKQVTLMEISNG